MRISDWSSDVCSSDLDRHHVVDDEIGEDDHVAALFGDPLGAFLAETGGQILLDRLDLALAFLAPQRNPVGDWPAPGREIFNDRMRSEEHTSELQSLMRISYAVFCLKKKKTNTLKL